MKPQYLGNKALLNKKLTAFFASRTVQIARVMACYDWATSLSVETDCVVSGFQSAIERDVLHFLLKKQIPVVVVLARTIYKHIPEGLREAYDNGRLLFISISNASRTSQVAAKVRNQYVADISSTIVFGMLSKESSLYEIYLRQSKDSNKEVKLIKS